MPRPAISSRARAEVPPLGLLTRADNPGRYVIGGGLGGAQFLWRYRSFSARLGINDTCDYIASYTAATVGRNVFKYKRTVIDLGSACQVRPAVSLTLDVANFTNEPQTRSRGISDRMERTIFAGTWITVGIGGRFRGVHTFAGLPVKTCFCFRLALAGRAVGFALSVRALSAPSYAERGDAVCSLDLPPARSLSLDR